MRAYVPGARCLRRPRHELNTTTKCSMALVFATIRKIEEELTNHINIIYLLLLCPFLFSFFLYCYYYETYDATGQKLNIYSIWASSNERAFFSFKEINWKKEKKCAIKFRQHAGGIHYETVAISSIHFYFEIFPGFYLFDAHTGPIIKIEEEAGKKIVSKK